MMVRPIFLLCLTAALFAVAACMHAESAPAGEKAAPAGLSGTNWRLVEIQSMDDRQGTSRPGDPAHYTLAFGTDGRVVVRLNCNRGRGPWQSRRADATGGSLQIGPLAITAALCPQPDLGEKLAWQLGYVRSFLLRDGRLYMSLMADGGIIVWEPAPAAG